MTGLQRWGHLGRHPESGLEEARQEEQRQHQADQAGQEASDGHAKGRRAGPLAPSPQGPGPEDDGDEAKQQCRRAQHALPIARPPPMVTGVGLLYCAPEASPQWDDRRS
jgi:hypothetical protein